MKEYLVRKVLRDDPAAGSFPDFRKVPEAEISEVLWLADAGIRAFAQVCYDDAALYVRLKAEEENIRAEHTGVLGMPCEDSCLEFFFAPMMGNDVSPGKAELPAAEDRRYFNIECNPNGCLFLGIGSGPAQLYRLVTETAEHAPVKPVTSRTARGWQCEYKVPFDFVRFFFPLFRPESGLAMRGNFYKCGDLTEQEHYLSWNRVDLPQPCFHCPDHFGILRFE